MVKIFENNFVDINDPENLNYVNREIIDDIKSHLQSRGKLEDSIIYKGYKYK